MNIELPYGWIKEFVKIKLTPETFAAELSLSGPSVDRWWRDEQGSEGVVVGEVRALEKHPKADKLRIAKTCVGKSELFIVCGGSNLREGMKVAVAPVGVYVKWHGEGEPVMIQKTKIRGVVSEGMICAADEIGLGNLFPQKQGEILDLSFVNAEPGVLIAEALELSDTILDIEVTSNRPDAFCAVGIAREASVILGAPFLWKSAAAPVVEAESVPVEIQLEAPKACFRYQAAVVKNVKVGPSPWWMQKRLMAAGIRPISNLVDITNYVMLETGHPLHVFDADCLEKKSGKYFITARMAKAGEKMLALDEKTYELNPSVLVIADAKKPVAIGGIMGSENTGVTSDTTTVIFESAAFDPVLIRRTARALNCQSDSSLRFEKGLSVESTAPALARAVELAKQIAGGESASPLYDRRAGPYKPLSYTWDPKESIRAIGVSIPVTTMKNNLVSLGFTVKPAGKVFKVGVPYWRDHDIEDSQDLTEEVARIYGYHKLPSVLPESRLANWPDQTELIWEDRLRTTFCGAGFTEVYSYSFISRDLLKKVGFEVPVLPVQNPLSEDLAVMRPSLVPSLLQVVADNETRISNSSVFEIANVYLPQKGELPNEALMLGGVIWGESRNGELFFQAKGMFEMLAKRWNIQIDFSSEKGSAKFLHPSRKISLRVLGKEIGVLGEVNSMILEQFGIKRAVAVFEINVKGLVSGAKSFSYESIPEFPPVLRDLSFFVPRKTVYQEIEAVIRETPLLREFALFDVYEGRGEREGKKSLAFHLTFADPSRTLTREEVDQALEKLVKNLQKKFEAEVRAE